ncbi:MAG: homocysteine S-methyltransferase family protein [Verrucomicrobiota bacterium]
MPTSSASTAPRARRPACTCSPGCPWPRATCSPSTRARGVRSFYEGRFSYEARPEYFADTDARWVEEGARLIGGDYGTRPAHIAAMAAVARALKPIRVKKLAAARPRVEVAGATFPFRRAAWRSPPFSI